MLNRVELVLAAKVALGLLYLLALQVGPEVLQETFTIFDYGRF